MSKKKLMIHDFSEMKERKEKITWITSYDYPTAQFAEAAGMDPCIEAIGGLPTDKSPSRVCG